MIDRKVVIGGTFDILHKGHKELLKKAFGLGKVSIGLVSDEMAEENKGRIVESFESRKKELEDYIEEETGRGAEILKINNKFGFAVEKDFDYIVVSPETYETALAINEERQRRNKKPIEIIKIEFILAEDGKPISSTRIFEKEINREGKIIK